jgi:hypothetical protein
MLDVIVGAIVKELKGVFVEQVEGKNGDRRRRSRLSVSGYGLLVVSLIASGVLMQRQMASAAASEAEWREAVDAHIEATPKALEEFQELKRGVINDREVVLSTLARHEDYMRALLLDRGQDPDRIAARTARRRAARVAAGLPPDPTPDPPADALAGLR